MTERPDHSTIHLTRIYTRTGDDGTTALGDMSRVPKTDPRIAAYADVEETNAVLGVALALGGLEPDLRELLVGVQNDLFDVGADLATPVDDRSGRARLRVSPAYVDRLERACDTYNARLGPLHSFLLPGGTPAAALLHHARTVARRAERAAWALLAADPEQTGPLPARYLNRLSDLLFILARVANPGGDVLWRPAASERSEADPST